MDRRMTVTWTSPPPTSVDEELVLDATHAWLVVRRPRRPRGSIGTYRTQPAVADRDALLAAGPGPVIIDAHRRAVDPTLAPIVAVAERIALACLEQPRAIVGFAASVTDVGADGTLGVALLAGADGTTQVVIQLRPAECTVHLAGADGPLTWLPMPTPATGFVTGSAEGVDGVLVAARLSPGVPVGTTFRIPDMPGAASLAIEVVGLLSEARPDEVEPRPFGTRTADVPIPR